MSKKSDRATDRIVLRNIVLTVLLGTGSAVLIATSCLGSDRIARDDGSASGISEIVAGVPSPMAASRPADPSVQSSAGGVAPDVGQTTVTGAQLERVPAPEPMPPVTADTVEPHTHAAPPPVTIEVRPPVATAPPVATTAPPVATATAAPAVPDAGEPLAMPPAVEDAGISVDEAGAGDAAAPRVIINPYFLPFGGFGGGGGDAGAR
jgi:hypothetical protein